MIEQFEVQFEMIRAAKDQLLRLRVENPDVYSRVFKNFVDPLRKKYRASELRGKYKPSWKIPAGSTNSMLAGFAASCEKNSCYHYHFGHPFYQSGRDREFPGDVSDGIVHTVFKFSEKHESHVILKVDESHPHPFRVPIHLISQIAATR